MLKITTHIERLLLMHDCVIVPKFGGFVLQTIPAAYTENEQLFRPARKEIVFNRTLQHNDGLLSESYMQLYNVNYRKAQLLLEEDVQLLQDTLQEQKNISVGKVGAFALGKEGQLIYTPGETELFSVASYGLPAFCLPQLQTLCTESEEATPQAERKRKDVFYIPVNRKLIRIVAASAAAVALFFLISTPVKDVNQAAYTASFIPSEIVSYHSRPQQLPTTDLTAQTSTPPEEEAAQPQVEATARIEPAPTTPPKKEAAHGEAIKYFHIVIASFPSEAQADEFIKRVDRTICRNVSKVARDGKYRIYADKFDNREQAETYMAMIRQHDTYKDAWMFISR